MRLLADNCFPAPASIAPVPLLPSFHSSLPCSTFTDTAMALSLTLLNALIDLVSFSGILYSIYPPLFAALLIYSLGGTAASVALGKVGKRGQRRPCQCRRLPNTTGLHSRFCD